MSSSPPLPPPPPPLTSAEMSLNNNCLIGNGSAVGQSGPTQQQPQPPPPIANKPQATAAAAATTNVSTASPSPSPAKGPAATAPPEDTTNSSAPNISLDKEGNDDQPFVVDEKKKPDYDINLYLYSEELDARPRASTFLNSIANYSNTIPSPGDPDAKPQRGGARMGTLVGVYLPCIQNIFGVILFIRLTWVVGTAGAVFGFLIVLLCCCVTMLTAISMSAIATNGVVPAGGSYFMIGRSLGPECGGAVGLLFYTGTTLAASMYIIGAIEILITYMAPGLSIFGDFTKDPSIMYNNFRVYGTFMLWILGLIVFVGVKLVNKFGAVALAMVLLSILAVYIGIFQNAYGSEKLHMCVFGTRLMQMNDTRNCTKEFLRPFFCTNHSQSSCDPYFLNHQTSIRKGIQGLASGVIKENLWNNFRSNGDILALSKDPADWEAKKERNNRQIYVDITTSFTLLIGIFFPSVTGIMAGSNRSGDLANAQRSIPIGTICAILTTSFVYLSAVILFAGTVDNLLLRDKFGQSIGGRLVVANIAWPNEWVILVGSCLSSLGAGLQSLTGAPRLLQAIAKDGIVPCLAPFAVSSSRGEPTRALIATLIICQGGILLGNVDFLAPLLAMFFLMCYAFVNLACGFQTLLKTPNWRPRFKYYHWSLSFVGLSLCISVMFMSNWLYALLAMGMAVIIYKYIEYRGAEKEWGDGMRGLPLSAARYSLLRLEEGPPHTKNWRPQLLLLAKLDDSYKPKYPKLFSFAAQLKAGKGLTVCVSVISGDYTKCSGDAVVAKQSIKKVMEDEKVKGFADVLISKDTTEGLSHLIQTTGLGGMKPNTVILAWPEGWNKPGNQNTWKVFLQTIRNISASKMALLIPKGIKAFPDSNTKVAGHIDIWWIVHDGGILMLIPFLLKQHRTWKNCKLRIFTVAQMEDNSIQMKKDLKVFLYNLRIEADVEVIEMMDKDISAYTYERTLVMEQRNQMLRELQLKKKETFGVMPSLVDFNAETPMEENTPLVQNIVDQHHYETKTPTKVRFQETPVHESNKSENKNNPDCEKEQNCISDNDPEAKKSILSKNDNKTRSSPQKLLTPDEGNVRRMHTAVKLNEVIRSKSSDAKLVIFNLPGPPKDPAIEKESNYMEFLEVLTEGLDCVLMVRGSGREVITIYS
ncbi:solute carrier family 12 member 4 isoform X3 [Planococcus citri]|uniref:solute carrier family 12 member 4 isoform X3 n=1 Tax=Planococcus citri TaxID=170843 RepID=UPI0031FA16FD